MISNRRSWRLIFAENPPLFGGTDGIFCARAGDNLELERIVSRPGLSVLAVCAKRSETGRSEVAGGVRGGRAAGWLFELAARGGPVRRIGLKFSTENGSTNRAKMLAVHRPDDGGFEIEERFFTSLRMTSKPARRVQMDRGADGQAVARAGTACVPLRSLQGLGATRNVACGFDPLRWFLYNRRIHCG